MVTRRISPRPRFFLIRGREREREEGKSIEASERATGCTRYDEKFNGNRLGKVAIKPCPGQIIVLALSLYIYTLLWWTNIYGLAPSSFG